jgi:hypothetical protein
MNTKALAQVLNTQGKATEKDGVIEIGAETGLTVYACLGSETLVISNVQSVKLLDEMVLATTSKGEGYVIVAQDIRALRFGKGENKRRTGLI